MVERGADMLPSLGCTVDPPAAAAAPAAAVAG